VCCGHFHRRRECTHLPERNLPKNAEHLVLCPIITPLTQMYCYSSDARLVWCFAIEHPVVPMAMIHSNTCSETLLDGSCHLPSAGQAATSAQFVSRRARIATKQGLLQTRCPQDRFGVERLQALPEQPLRTAEPVSNSMIASSPHEGTNGKDDRGIVDKRLLPVPPLHRMEEREKHAIWF